MTEFEPPTIRYTVQQLLERIESKVDLMVSRIDNKADRVDLEKTNLRIDHVADRTDLLERKVDHFLRGEEEKKDWRRWLWPVLLTVLMIGVTIVVPLLTSHK